MRTNRSPASIVALAAGLTVAMGTSGAAAPATDLDEVRARAQAVADRVSALERRLAALRSQQAVAAEEATRATQRIALLERRLESTSERLERARSRYVERAVEAYKEGPTGRLALVLSADEPSDLLDIAEAQSRAAAADRDTLARMQRALAAQSRAQEATDARKQRLLAAQAEAAALGERVEATLAERRSTLRELNEEVARLERAARLRALRAAGDGDVGAAFAQLLRPTGPAPAIPDGYVGTGVVFEGIASWYGPGFEGEATANGQIFDPDLYTAASRDLPFGTILHVTYEGKGVVVVINDRGPYLQERILDLSQAAAEAIGLGLGWVRAEIVVPER